MRRTLYPNRFRYAYTYYSVSVTLLLTRWTHLVMLERDALPPDHFCVRLLHGHGRARLIPTDVLPAEHGAALDKIERLLRQQLEALERGRWVACDGRAERREMYAARESHVSAREGGHPCRVADRLAARASAPGAQRRAGHAPVGAARSANRVEHGTAGPVEHVMLQRRARRARLVVLLAALRDERPAGQPAPLCVSELLYVHGFAHGMDDQSGPSSSSPSSSSVFSKLTEGGSTLGCSSASSMAKDSLRAIHAQPATRQARVTRMRHLDFACTPMSWQVGRITHRVSKV